MLNKIFPSVADNNFYGQKIALWGFILFTLVMTWRSIVHMLFEEYGFHEIGNFRILQHVAELSFKSVFFCFSPRVSEGSRNRGKLQRLPGGRCIVQLISKREGTTAVAELIA